MSLPPSRIRRVAGAASPTAKARRCRVLCLAWALAGCNAFDAPFSEFAVGGEQGAGGVIPAAPTERTGIISSSATASGGEGAMTLDQLPCTQSFVLVPILDGGDLGGGGLDDEDAGLGPGLGDAGADADADADAGVTPTSEANGCRFHAAGLDARGDGPWWLVVGDQGTRRIRLQGGCVPGDTDFYLEDGAVVLCGGACAIASGAAKASLCTDALIPPL